MVPAETKEMLALSFALLQACQGKWSRSISPAHLLSRGRSTYQMQGPCRRTNSSAFTAIKIEVIK